jgi:ribosomal-protein-alanine N-acetyltransferase
VIETERLVLRPVERRDLDTVARWNADPEHTRHLMGVQTREQTVEAIERWLAHWDERGFGMLAVEWKATGELIGRSGPQYHRAWPHDPEVGWGFDPAWWGRGLATEAGRASIEWAFGELGFERVVSITTEANVASRRVMEKLGFRLLELVPFPELGLDLWVHALDRKPLYP